MPLAVERKKHKKIQNRNEEKCRGVLTFVELFSRTLFIRLLTTSTQPLIIILHLKFSHTCLGIRWSLLLRAVWRPKQFVSCWINRESWNVLPRVTILFRNGNFKIIHSLLFLLWTASKKLRALLQGRLAAALMSESGTIYLFSIFHIHSRTKFLFLFGGSRSPVQQLLSVLVAHIKNNCFSRRKLPPTVYFRFRYFLAFRG